MFETHLTNNIIHPSELSVNIPPLETFQIGIHEVNKSDSTTRNQPQEQLQKPKRQKAIVWKPEEDERLFKLVNMYGHKWIQFQKYFPGLTDLQIKNRWYSNIRRAQRRLLSTPSKKRKNLTPTQQQMENYFLFIQNIDSDHFWDNHLNEECFLKECMDIYNDISV